MRFRVDNSVGHEGGAMHALSKSKLLAYRQCQRRLWLEVHHPELRTESAAAQASFRVGHQVGDVARRLYDRSGRGSLIDPKKDGYAVAIARTAELLAQPRPIFEAGFAAGGAMAFADVLLPRVRDGRRVWRMVEVKSSTDVKGYHRDDTAVQAFVARGAGVPLTSIAVAHIDGGWLYPGCEDYRGLLVEKDVTKEAFGRKREVQAWISGAQKVLGKRHEPEIRTGRHCGDPYECGFRSYCESKERQPRFPARWLPAIQARALRTLIEEEGVVDMRRIPDALLNEAQLRVKSHTLAGKTYFDRAGAITDLAAHRPPAYFLDFETVQFAVPIWKWTRPYQQIPFQFSLHHISRGGKLDHQMFLDLSGDDPSRSFAESLIGACGASGPIFVYNAAFETARISELAARFKRLKRSLMAVNERIVDLHPVAKRRYYHPSQRGSWSIKNILPSIAKLDYHDLEGIQDGGMAMNAYLEAIAPATGASRKDEINSQLRAYCALDTFALIKLWQFFSGRGDLRL